MLSCSTLPQKPYMERMTIPTGRALRQSVQLVAASNKINRDDNVNIRIFLNTFNLDYRPLGYIRKKTTQQRVIQVSCDTRQAENRGIEFYRVGNGNTLDRRRPPAADLSSVRTTVLHPDLLELQVVIAVIVRGTKIFW